ncbi:AGE family epimerase/isomerase [Solicola gregarius]|uniref:AGE family epimerase/isomerase n=1 Tax=Solicola gregarius TaxID=2908642 RepID=A0AA46YLJ8_9ACTN|nr:AGE family epimerase/isomerase [Solicola gregarius]UYM05576.1 AGE family epimerase/isomerase [Solicola gregarius]
MSDQTVPGSKAWRTDQLTSVRAFAERSALHSGGFGWLDPSGDVDESRGLELWINARMTYVFSLASLLDRRPHPLAEHGVRALTGPFADAEHGGWFQSVTSAHEPASTTKGCYEHAFVILAASTARTAGVGGADALLESALDVHERRFWDEAAGRCRESWNADWSEPESYRGANSNMHTVEAYLAAADVTGDRVWRDRALSICERIINRAARANGWRIPEHFDADWNVVLDYNTDVPADAFRPYGATPGHGFEWSRLLLELEAALDDPPAWLVDAAVSLFEVAVRDGSVDDTLVYTTGWDGKPVVRERFHWVMAEAVAAADALARRTNGSIGPAEANRWYGAIDEHFVDRVTGSWHHELDDTLQVSARTWPGKPDAYHIVNAMLLPDAPLAVSLARSLT